MSEVLWAAGQPIVGFDDLVRRYCGLPWSGGAPEVWAYTYYDAVTTTDADIGPVDVLATAALHPGLSQTDLAWFVEAAKEVADVLAALPRSASLTEANQLELGVLENLPALAAHRTGQAPGGVGLSLLSKVLHRKRPRLIPLIDRAITERYRHVTGRKGVSAWPSLVHALSRADLCNRDNAQILARLSIEMAEELETPVPSHLRLLDIAVWMDERTGARQ